MQYRVDPQLNLLGVKELNLHHSERSFSWGINEDADLEIEGNSISPTRRTALSAVKLSVNPEWVIYKVKDTQKRLLAPLADNETDDSSADSTKNKNRRKGFGDDGIWQA